MMLAYGVVLIKHYTVLDKGHNGHVQLWSIWEFSVKRGGGLLKMTEFKKFKSCFKVYDDN